MKATPQKRPIMLFELMIALALTAILLTLLFRFFAGSVNMNQKIDSARSVLYHRQHFQTRLSSIFHAITPRSLIGESVSSSFFTLDEKTPALLMIFDNGIDPDPQFSGPILGKIYLDAGNLTLALWPLEKKEKKLYRKEILLPHVQKMQFQFLAKKTVQNQDPLAISINPLLEWRTNWPKNRWDIPSIIRMKIEQDREEVSFAFMLPFIEPIVTYQGATG